MQQFDGLAGGSELRLRIRQCAKFRAVFDSVATQDDAGFGKHPGAGIPDGIYRPADKGKAAVDVAFLLPEAAGLPSNFVSGVIGSSRAMAAFNSGEKSLSIVLRMVKGKAQMQ